MTPEAALQDLLLQAFSSEELRSYLELRYPAIKHSLPGRDANFERLTTDAIEALARNKLLDARFFDELAAARRNHAEAIHLLRQHWPGAPDAAAQPELVCIIDPGEAQWTLRALLPDAPTRHAPSPLTDEAFRRDLEQLASSQPVLLDDPESDDALAAIEAVARRIGARLTDLLLPADTRAALRERMAGVDGITRLTLRISEGPLADVVLALPWELLMPEPGRFAVHDAKLAVVRDGARPGAPRLEVPVAALAVAATIAAPEDRPTLSYEEEAFRMLKALSYVDAPLAFAELGELDDLAELVHRMHATVVHFSGHASIDGLLFEDDLGRSKSVTVLELMARLRQHAQGDGFPRLFFLAARGPADIYPISSALHREGFACVLAYTGSVADPQCTLAEVAFYRSLAAGDQLLFAVQQARIALAGDYVHDGRRLRHPLGWSRLAVYLRGDNLPLSIRPRRAPPRSASRLQRDVIAVSGLPVLEHGFIGRRGLLHEIHRKRRLEDQRLFVLHGLGGLGKTALASHLLRKLLAPDPADQLILRVQQATEVSTLRAQAEAHGDYLKIADWPTRLKELHESHPDPVDGFHQTILILRGHRPDLVIYADNMEALQVGPVDPSDADTPALGTWRPGVDRWWKQMEALSKTGTVVLASTRYMWKGIHPRAFIALDRMSPADLWRMIDTLPELSQLPQPVRDRIAETVDGRPRTLVLLDGLIGQGIEDPTLSPTDVWSEWVEPVLREHGDELTEDLLLDRLWHHLSPAARNHASAIAILQQPAPRSVIDALGVAFLELLRAGLLTRHRQPADEQASREPHDRWFMLTVVRDFARAHAPFLEQGHLAHSAAEAYRELAPTMVSTDASDLVETIRLYRMAGDADLAWPLIHFHALWLRERGSYGEAQQLLVDSKDLAFNERNRVEYYSVVVQFVILTGHNPTGIVVETLTADLEDASDALKILKLHSAALLQSYHGRYAEAETLHRNTIELIETRFNGVHPSLYATRNNLAQTLIELGRYAEAMSIFMGEIQAASKPPDSAREVMDRSTLLNNLATAFMLLGRLDMAEQAIDAALALKAAAFSREHPTYGQSLTVRGNCMQQKGRFEASAEDFRAALKILGETLGEQHPSYVATLAGLASVMDDLDVPTEAESLMRRALDIQIASRGKDHPDTLTVTQNLAVMLAHHGQFEEAEHLLRTSMTAQDAALGTKHHSAGTARLNLASILAQQHRYDEAPSLLLEADTILRSALGEQHPEYASFLRNTADVAVSMGDLDFGLRLTRMALAISEQTLGSEHPSTENILRGLGQILLKLRDTPGADQSLESFIAAQRADFGEDHVSLYYPLSLLAEISAAKGHYQKARTLLERSVQIARKHLPPEHEHQQGLERTLSQVEYVLASGRAIRSWSGRKRRLRPPKK